MKVSVVMLTYNHEQFIAQAIESVLMQQVNFSYELVIGEDCSTDSTRDIVIQYGERHPETIRLLLREKNLGAMGKPNFVDALRHCQGKYIAMLEGDDYWTSPHKLQKQADYLDNHPECAMCFHSTKVIYDDGRPPHISSPPVYKKPYELRDLLQRNFIATVSVMFRSGLFDEFPSWYYDVPMGDWPLYVLNAEYGKIGYIDEVMSVYRRHAQGCWSSRELTRNLQAGIAMYEVVNAHLDYRYDRIIKAGIFFNSYRIAMEQGKRWSAFVNLMKCLVRSPSHHAVSSWGLSKIILELVAPELYNHLRSRKRAHERSRTQYVKT